VGVAAAGALSENGARPPGPFTVIYHDRPATHPDRPRPVDFWIAVGLAVAAVACLRFAWPARLPLPLGMVAAAGGVYAWFACREVKLGKTSQLSLAVALLLYAIAVLGFDPVPDAWIGLGPHPAAAWAWVEGLALAAWWKRWPPRLAGWRPGWSLRVRGGGAVALGLLALGAVGVGLNAPGTGSRLSGSLACGLLFGPALALWLLGLLDGRHAEGRLSFRCPRCGTAEHWQQGGSDSCVGCGLVIRASWGADVEGEPLLTRRPVTADCPACGREQTFQRGTNRCTSCDTPVRLEWAER